MTRPKKKEEYRWNDSVFLFSIIIIICAQLNINFFISNFKISMGIIMIPTLLMLLGEYPILPVTILSAAGVFLSRIAVYWFQHESIAKMPEGYFPEMIFYLVYGCLFYLYCRKHNHELRHVSFVALFFFDYFSNLTELLCRLGFSAFSGKTQLSILLVALIRTILIWCIYLVLRYYKFSLLRREHAQRYQRLLLLISKLNGEVLWMKKNTGLIEETMKTSYQLYQQMQEEELDPDLSKKALFVAKDIHEIKKEYTLILRGLSEALDLNLEDEGMYLSDILFVLANSLNTSSSGTGMQLELQTQLDEDLYTENHYFLMSIFRNLFTNAMEAGERSVVHISFSETSSENAYVFQITDDGPGIAEEDIDQIFSPGFSTKINYDTGEVNRGLGLNLVQDLIENQWKGKISVSSVPGNTTFHIEIPKNTGKVKKNETLFNR